LSERRSFIVAAFALWLLFFIQALYSPILEDDWFQLRELRDHNSLWSIWHYNYFHYNPRIGEVILTAIDRSRALHLIATPLVQLAVLPTTFAIALGRLPRRTLRDLQLLLFIQVMVWLVIPIPGIMYFYRPFATNYVWAFTITLALFVPYRLNLGPRAWLVPVMFVLGWAAGMCNEHTGPTAIVAIAGFLVARRRQLRAWMVSGALGLLIGYPMLFFAPGQTVRYSGLATRATPTAMLATRGITGCLEILRDFFYESRLGLLLFVAILVRYLVTIYKREGPLSVPRELFVALVLIAASCAIVVTLFMSPMTTDRVLYASGVLLVAGLAICAQLMFEDRSVRYFAVGACAIIFGYHVVRFTITSVHLAGENDDRIARLNAATPGGVVAVPSYDPEVRSRWEIGEDFQPWLRDYVAGELFDIARIDLDERDPHPATHLVPAGSPTYRMLLAAPELRFLWPTITEVGLFDSKRPLYLIDHSTFYAGRPEGHAVRVDHTSDETYVVGCGEAHRATASDGLVPIDERFCRGPFTVVTCERDRCAVAGWY
jgi:hypothetical protein